MNSHQMKFFYWTETRTEEGQDTEVDHMMTEGQAGQDHLGIDHHRGREMDKLDGLVSQDSNKIGQGHQVKISPRKQLFLMMSPPSWIQDLEKWKVILKE